jgi:hypothetical protein
MTALTARIGTRSEIPEGFRKWISTSGILIFTGHTS